MKPAVARRCVGLAAFFVLVFVYQFLLPIIYNDHFEHLSTGQSLVLGDLPGRDFSDPRPLTSALSAVVQLVFGRSLLWEVILTISGISAGVVLVWVLTRLLTRSGGLATVTALVAMVFEPRLYAYPKVLVFSGFGLLLLRAIERRKRHWLLLLGGGWGLAFMFRHDFGVYVGAAVLADFAFDSWRGGTREAWRRTLAVCVAASVVAGPYVVWVLVQGDRDNSVADGVRSLVGAATITVRPFQPKSLFTIDPAVTPVVSVRWVEGLTDEQRKQLERRFRLESVRALKERTGWYGLTDTSTNNLGLLVADPRVEDVGDFDWSRSRLDERWQTRAKREWSILRVGSPFFRDPTNSENIVYLVMIVVPLAAGLVVFGCRRRWRDATGSWQWQGTGSLAVMAIALNVFLVRGNLDSRLPDIAPINLFEYLAGRYRLAAESDFQSGAPFQVLVERGRPERVVVDVAGVRVPCLMP